MNQEKLQIIANSLAGLAQVTNFFYEEILDCLEGFVFSEEETSEIKQYINNL